MCMCSKYVTHCKSTTYQVTIHYSCYKGLVPVACCQMIFHVPCLCALHPNQYANSCFFQKSMRWCHRFWISLGPRNHICTMCKYAGHCLLACHAQNLYPLDKKTFDQNCLQCLHLWFFHLTSSTISRIHLYTQQHHIVSRLQVGDHQGRNLQIPSIAACMLLKGHWRLMCPW